MGLHRPLVIAIVFCLAFACLVRAGLDPDEVRKAAEAASKSLDVQRELPANSRMSEFGEPGKPGTFDWQEEPRGTPTVAAAAARRDEAVKDKIDPCGRRPCGGSAGDVFAGAAGDKG